MKRRARNIEWANRKVKRRLTMRRSLDELFEMIDAILSDFVSHYEEIALPQSELIDPNTTFWQEDSLVDRLFERGKYVNNTLDTLDMIFVE